MISFLLESAVRSLVLGAVVWIALRLLRIKTSPVGSLAWTAVLLTSMAMPALMPAMKAFMTRAPAAAKWIPVVPPALSLKPLAPEVPATAPPLLDGQTIASGIYLAVVAVLLLRLIAGVWQSRRLWKASVPLSQPWVSGMDVRVCAELGIPATYGSTILLPSDWPEWSVFKRDAVLLHEKTHVRRGDFYIHLLAGLHRAAFWFSPLAWWLPKRHLELAEAICDDTAIRHLGDRVSYAEILLDFAERGAREGFVGVAMARGNTVEHRVERLLQGTSTTSEVSMIRRVVMIAAFVPLAGLAAGSWLVQAKALSASVPAVMPSPQQAPQPAPTQYLVMWADQEVPDIITQDERSAFEKLSTDQVREQFITQFWLRRDPTPGTPANEYRSEYYQRIAQANQKFPTKSGTPGWRTDRGRILILQGPPDEIETHAQPPGTMLPFERWRYRHIEGMGDNIILEFVDVAKDDNYRLQGDPFKAPLAR